MIYFLFDRGNTDIRDIARPGSEEVNHLKPNDSFIFNILALELFMNACIFNWKRGYLYTNMGMVPVTR